MDRAIETERPPHEARQKFAGVRYREVMNKPILPLILRDGQGEVRTQETLSGRPQVDPRECHRPSAVMITTASRITTKYKDSVPVKRTVFQFNESRNHRHELRSNVCWSLWTAPSAEAAEISSPWW